MSEKHGMAETPEYKSWGAMRDRCGNPRNQSYQRYGARGITVCAEWDSFSRFLADMGPRPSMAHTLDRIDNNGNYEKSNCRWATKNEQSRNKRNNVLISFNGQTKCIADWAASLGMGRAAMRYRLHNGWTIEEALTTPSKLLRRKSA